MRGEERSAVPLWPIHPKPFPDELLSSWMVRIAHAYRIRPASFWKHQAGSVHFRKVDLTAEDRLLHLIGLKTGTPLDRVVATTLRAYRECGVDWHGGHENVIRFCPACLEERPCFRRRWRLDFFTVCDVHEFFFHNRCPSCRGLVRMERVPPGAGSVAMCHNCGFDLRRAPPKVVPSKAREVVLLQTRLLRLLDAGQALQREETAGTVVRTGMQVAAGRRDAGMAEGSLHQVNGRAAVEGMGGVRMAKPVRRNGDFNAGAISRLANDPQDSQRPEPTAVFGLTRFEHGIGGTLVRPQTAHQFPHGGGYLNGAGEAALSEHGNLAAVSVRLQVPPGEPAQFADPHAGSIEQREDSAIAEIRLQAQDAMQIRFGEDALGEPVANGGQPQRAAHVERQIADPVPECQEGFEGREGTVSAGRCEIAQPTRELLQIGQGDLA